MVTVTRLQMPVVPKMGIREQDQDAFEFQSQGRTVHKLRPQHSIKHKCCGGRQFMRFMETAIVALPTRPPTRDTIIMYL